MNDHRFENNSTSPPRAAAGNDARSEFGHADAGEPALETTERTIARIIDGEAARAEWLRFMQSADAAPRLWRTLAIGQREARLLGDALSDALWEADAKGVAEHRRGATAHRSLQAASGSATNATERPSAGAFSSDSTRLGFGARLGWAMAACIAGAWIVSAGRTPQEPLQGQSPTIQQATFLSPHQALEAYLSLGRESGAVVGELPGKPIIERRILDDGQGYEVVFVRQIVERSRVEALFSFEGSDEFGEPVPTPIRPTSPGRGSL